MLALEDMQVAVIRYLRELIGTDKVGDLFPQDNNLKEYVHLQEANVETLPVKDMERFKVSFTFHILSDAKNGSGNFLYLVECVDSLEDADLPLENHTLDMTEITATHSFVDVKTDKSYRHGIIMIDFKITKLK